METYCTEMYSPVGPLVLVGNGAAVTEIRFRLAPGAAGPEAGWKQAREPFREAVRQLEAYFAGELRQFELPLAPSGTPFQQRVWRELRRIPWGTTVSYREIANRIGQPGAARAVGAANGQNRIPIIIPCHRVIGADGRLTGFAGGLDVKKRLLTLEGVRGTSPYLPARGAGNTRRDAHPF
jgi:methylated-DNA-[protein]-cysteine S-methyltransferase